MASTFCFKPCTLSNNVLLSSSFVSAAMVVVSLVKSGTVLLLLLSIFASSTLSSQRNRLKFMRREWCFCFSNFVDVFCVLSHAPPLPLCHRVPTASIHVKYFFSQQHTVREPRTKSRRLWLFLKSRLAFSRFLSAVLIFSRGRFQNQTFNRRYNRDILRLCVELSNYLNQSSSLLGNFVTVTFICPVFNSAFVLE